jgi:hypothetical protein
MPKFLLLFLLISFYAFSQKTIIGVVSYTLNQPLESANLISKALQENQEFYFLHHLFTILANKLRAPLKVKAI